MSWRALTNFDVPAKPHSFTEAAPRFDSARSPTIDLYSAPHLFLTFIAPESLKNVGIHWVSLEQPMFQPPRLINPSVRAYPSYRRATFVMSGRLSRSTPRSPRSRLKMSDLLAPKAVAAAKTNSSHPQ